MRDLNIPIEQLVARLVNLADDERLCLLDSSGVSHLGSHLMIAGVRPIALHEFRGATPDGLALLSRISSISTSASWIFTISYEFGAKMLGISPYPEGEDEPDIYAAGFECLIVHDYSRSKTFLTGNERCFDEIEDLLKRPASAADVDSRGADRAISNFSRSEYIEAVKAVQEHIRDGYTYQANLTQQFHSALGGLRDSDVFLRLRRDHPAPFSAFLRRNGSTVISASPERFFRAQFEDGKRSITASPIKGTRPRGMTREDDAALRQELLSSEKDRAENTMIVDLLRNDLGRVCEFGSVHVDSLCSLEEHPTLFHLVSTIRGRLRAGIDLADIIEAMFPCGSITGAPKIRTMQLIRDIEPSPRGLSMGSIGVHVPPTGFAGLEPSTDLSVAIRTIVVRDGIARFNVGGGIVIDSDSAAEYSESLLKAKALLAALGVA